jgi:SRSO17 transposase
MVLPQIERHGAVRAWIIDDTSFPKHGLHSVGVTHQYCGELGKQENCQVAVSLSVANHQASLPVAYRLYLPKSWSEDRKRRRKAGVPDQIEFKTKPKIALEQLAWACAAGLPRGVVLMDSAYGSDASLRRGARDLGLDYSVAVWARTLVEGGAGKMKVEELAAGLPKRAWKTVAWREGVAEPLRSRFARVRVRARGEGCTRNEPEEWLLIEWPKGETAPTKFWLSTLPTNIAFDRLVDITMMRWRIERDYQELKQEVGLGHFEGRGWRGFHHHATMCIAAYGFLISERGAFPPSQARCELVLQELAVPAGYRPRGSAVAA